ncbi:MAG: FRG domain-containing protein, partial [Gammaproteobacteria bacterium]|nr:FRG domain-containing protein [Gammaproteobacteria bacterium]
KIDGMPADEYYKALKKAHNEIKKMIPHDEISQSPLPDQNPLLWMLMTAGTGTQHHQEVRDTMKTIRTFRHFGFPSPLLDWTRDINIALFFAASNIESNDNIAIYRLKKCPPQKTFKLNYQYDIFAIDLNSMPGCSRDTRQQSVYTIAMHQDLLHTHPPSFYLPAYDNINFQAMQIDHIKIEKYVITDSGEKRLKILNELYDQDLSFEAIYEKTHALETTTLKDLAIKLFLLPEKTQPTQEELEIITQC